MAVATLLREFALKMFSFVTRREPEKSRSGAAGAFRLRKMLRRDKVAHAGSTIQFSDGTVDDPEYGGEISALLAAAFTWAAKRVGWPPLDGRSWFFCPSTF